MNRPPGLGGLPPADPLAYLRRIRTREPGWRTSEFGVFVLVALGNLIAAAVVSGSDGRGDAFPADTAWFYITLLAIGYLISRGLAKIGSAGRAP
jgi:hypothetical protein